MNPVLKLLLEGEALDTVQMGKILGLGADAVARELEQLRKDGVLLGLRPVLNPSWEAERRVRAVIEIKVRPEGRGGFDGLAERISAFEQVESCHLMSGGYDLLVIVTADNLYKVASFVHERLARIEGVQGTSTHFILRAYKKDGFVVSDDRRDGDKPQVSA
jgi:DNA-binding Lrp family transcriptional regulator